ncbi:hypothetical protein H6F52_04490 [Coleofasciculus sp. FACHB-542]|uniref:hypothetical protein n=1 Tax=Coleofasciculus sp. FACHB-SPT9 TaxID=2692791 RepID=UPI0019BF35F5|nr:hypothetical protein [Coleofasciculus sp. FACHB-SPT9]MBD2084249.1 hypothetical protein [Coleofasciculus sp. FACHB-542]
MRAISAAGRNPKVRRHSLSIEYTRERSLGIHLPHIKVRTDKSALRYRVLLIH